VTRAWALLATTTGVIWAGFVAHTSSGTDLLLGRYSPAYAAFLAAVTCAWLVILGWSWRQRRRLASVLRNLLLGIGVSFLVAWLTLPLAYIYLHNRSLDADILAPLPPEAHAFFQYEVTPSPPADDPPDGVRILALGGSTTYGVKLERDEAYPAVLERLLRERYPEHHLTVLNAGVPWHTSMHSLLRYVARFSDWRPRIVVVMHAFNDIYQTSEGRLTTGAFRADYGHFFGALGERVNPRDEFRERVRRALFENGIARIWYSDLRSKHKAIAPRRVDLLRALPAFRHNLTQLVYRASQDGAEVIVASQPFLYRKGMSGEERARLFYAHYYRDYAIVPTIDEQRAAMQSFNDSAREVCRRTGARFVDVEAGLPKSTAYMYDDVHFTAEGARRVAGTLLEEIPWEELLGESRAPAP
jgi:lysophospholipase L1-like esterase